MTALVFASIAVTDPSVWVTSSVLPSAESAAEVAGPEVATEARTLLPLGYRTVTVPSSPVT